VSFSSSLPRLERPQDGAPPFVARIDFVDGSLKVSGRLDHRTAHVFIDAARTLLSSDAAAWAIDVGGLTGCDLDGLRAISAGYRLALRHGRRLTLVGAPCWLREALARLRLDHHLLASGQGTTTTGADGSSASLSHRDVTVLPKQRVSEPDLRAAVAGSARS
jgi:anti-anti-sigma regulatory factor